MTLKFRDRIALLVALPAVALIAVTLVTLVLGRLNRAQLTGIETHYLPLIELDRDAKALFARVPRALEDAASAAEDAKLAEADALADELRVRLLADARTIVLNGGDPQRLLADFESYYARARSLSAALIASDSPDDLAPQIEAMRQAQVAFAARLDQATSPDRERLVAAFRGARATQTQSLWIDIVVAAAALALMVALSWRIIRRTVGALAAVSVGVERMAQGDFGHRIEFAAGDELGDLVRQANDTARKLHEYRERLERAAWIETGLTELAEHTGGELDPAALADKAVRQLAGYLPARAAAAYALDDDSGLAPLARFAAGGDGSAELAPPALAADDVAAAVDVRADDPAVASQAIAGGHRVVVPLVHDGRAIGAVALVLAEAPSARQLELLGRVRTALGIALRVAESRRRESALLHATQRHAAEVRTANQELEAFSYSVSHDLRTPLRGIDGFSQALLEDYHDVLDATGQDYLRRVRAAAQRMAELIDDLLSLSRVSRADLAYEAVDLSAQATAIAAELQRGDPSRSVELRIEPGIVVRGDPRLLRITLENLLGNAWKFTGRTAGAVIELGRRRDGDDEVLFVRDNGAGFDMQYAERLFGAFQRLHTEREFPGTGIGLATVQRIIHRHHGRIWVDAAVDRGATFSFTLPAGTPGAPLP
jgi:signal transduction histidine kinase